MRHLYLSVVRAERVQLTMSDGRAKMDWAPIVGGEFIECRLDLNFVRPGKDIPAAPVAGRAPDRIGVMFCDAEEVIRAGDRVVAIPNDEGEMPVQGTFEIKVIPDVALDYSSAHHVEVQIVEMNQKLDEWPEDKPLEDEPVEETP